MLTSTGSGGGEFGKTKREESSFIFSSTVSSCQMMGARLSLSMEMENTSSSGGKGELDTR